MKKFQSDLQSSDLLQCPAESLDDLALQYQSTLSSVLDVHAPLVLIKVSQRPSQPWFCSEIAEAKNNRRRLERRWRRTKLEIDRLSFIEARNNVCKLTSMAKTSFYSRRIDALSCNQKALFREMNHLLNQSTVTPMPPYESPGVLANQFADYFSSKIDLIRRELNHCVPHSLLAPGTCSQTEMNINKFSAFDSVSIRTVSDLISSCPAKTCDLDPVPTWLLKDCSEQLAPAIASMINLSLSTGTLPSSWKDAIVLPSLKFGKKELIMEYYRPISNLPFISKLCEKVVAMQLSDHLLRNNLMEPFQSAYRPNHSVETALLRVCNDILRSMDQRKITVLVLLDLSAAFDTVDHQILLHRLQSRFGVTGVVLDWFTSYLTGRRQCVTINDTCSNPKLLKCGVPQGSVLGPLLFLVYVSPLGNVIRKHGLDFHFFADDTQLYLAFDANAVGSLSDALSTVLAAINDVKDWLRRNLLKFNISKTELSLIGSSQQLSKLSGPVTICMDNHVIVAVEVVRNLGLYIDQHMKLNAHVNKVMKGCLYHLRNISKIRKYLSIDAAKSLIHALVTSRLDCCNSLLYGCKKSSIQCLQRLQNYAARVICKVSKYDHITPILKELHWLPVQARIEYKLLTLTFKCVHDKAPTYLSELVLRHVPSRPGLRSLNNVSLFVPKTISRADKSTADRAFSLSAPKLWNTLPPEIRNTRTIIDFKRKLKTFLFAKYF